MTLFIRTLALTEGILFQSTAYLSYPLLGFKTLQMNLPLLTAKVKSFLLLGLTENKSKIPTTCLLHKKRFRNSFERRHLSIQCQPWGRSLFLDWLFRPLQFSSFYPWRVLSVGLPTGMDQQGKGIRHCHSPGEWQMQLIPVLKNPNLFLEWVKFCGIHKVLKTRVLL